MKELVTVPQTCTYSTLVSVLSHITPCFSLLRCVCTSWWLWVTVRQKCGWAGSLSVYVDVPAWVLERPPEQRPSCSAPRRPPAVFSRLRPASLTKGWRLRPRDAFASNDRHRNTKLVQTGFVLIFQCINYKNIRLHYTFAILLSNWSVVVCYPSEKSPLIRLYFCELSVHFPSATWAKRR